MKKRTIIFHVTFDLALFVVTLVWLLTGGIDVLTFVMTVVPPIVSSAVTLLFDWLSSKREKKLKSLKEMISFANLIDKAIQDMQNTNLYCERRGFPCHNIENIVGKQFEDNFKSLSRFFTEFSLKKRRERLLATWKSSPRAMLSFLTDIEKKMALSEMEKLYIREAKK